MREQAWPEGRITVIHRWKHASILAQAARHDVPLTVHPGIGYDIIANHPVFNGAAIGRAAECDFKLFGGSLANLEGGVVLSIGSAIMGPQVFEKALSCVNNLRLQAGPGRDPRPQLLRRRPPGRRQLGLDRGEPPKNNPAYYLRFCKSYSRMGGALHYVQCDNLTFVHHLYRPAAKLMKADRFAEITERYSRLRIAVVGDFFLDRYLHIDPAKNETSIETGLPVYNVVEVRSQPGAAGTILNNLVALGIGEIHAIGFCGDDGEGYELRQALAARAGVNLERLPHHALAPNSRLLQASDHRARSARRAN